MALGRDTSFTWYGHSCLEIRTPGGRTVLVDPWFGNPMSPRRVDEVDRCDVLLVTHGHFDHIGGTDRPDAIVIAERLAPAWVAIHELQLWLAATLARGADECVGMNKGGRVEAAGIGITMVHAEHSAGDVLAGADTPRYLGEPVGFVLELENGFRVYLAGDTTVFGDMRLIRELYRPEMAVLPIGGHYTMGPREAALAVELLGVSDVLPVHYGTFPVLTGTPTQLRDALAERGLADVRVHEPAPGETVS
jgi:L-ascorbate metabolism protein UlaG (beta-lactamase superfamily)